jgi:hypothetical protein
VPCATVERSDFIFYTHTRLVYVYAMLRKSARVFMYVIFLCNSVGSWYTEVFTLNQLSRLYILYVCCVVLPLLTGGCNKLLCMSSTSVIASQNVLCAVTFILHCFCRDAGSSVSLNYSICGSLHLVAYQL